MMVQDGEICETNLFMSRNTGKKLKYQMNYGCPTMTVNNYHVGICNESLKKDTKKHMFIFKFSSSNLLINNI